MDNPGVILSAAASEQRRPGDTLGIVLVVPIVGAARLAGFLLRGHRDRSRQRLSRRERARTARIRCARSLRSDSDG
ncbi:hypothetical protein BKD26_02000 [Streptomyces sp. CB03238]|nr:hypothetical protein BKD26_02000 [Streptomyces sp. CB03238]